jgi:ABC-type Mn2+/Zn2+ transport system ATPase subunit
MNTTATKTKPLLSVHDLTVTYEDAPALDHVNFSIKAGDYIAIIGPNGAGKSTLMKSIMGLLQPQKGHVYTAPELGLPGYVPQHQEVAWDFPVTVAEVVMMGLTRHIGWFRWPSRQNHLQVMQALERVGMADYAQRQIGELSGGQRQRVFIARALAQNVRLLLLDEPFSGVDAVAQASLMDVIDSIHAAGIAVLLSTHDLGLAFQRFPTIMALNKRLIALGPAKEVTAPAVLRELYGSGIATIVEGQGLTLFVDEHKCC